VWSTVLVVVLGVVVDALTPLLDPRLRRDSP
jgi:ABC-type dipeptide/oligopeptide/nickel transport system permease component